ncbi:hypothetical protein SLW70_09805 [Flavobacterium sp. NG2]|uniref:hypothetical protein n=1 Tax=Flavobacterium sp. NG2 TaxID=3097547 RepID=UPI002A8007A0|nr:hypothetical protein [Flavobacterium sp. NG2]WPR70239.1 hypothetical protein SLW70_09805 [Flavobacterium sp. NG2]
MITPNKIILLFSFILVSFTSCTTHKTTLANGKQIDNRLVGVWQGSEYDKQKADLKKEWIMERNLDGTFTLDFKTIYKGKTDGFTESGNWWIKGNTFYEHHTNSDKTDTYKYTVLNDQQIEFKMLSTEIDFNDANYTFIDTKVSKETPQSSNADGLSLDTALKVKSIKEEYEYVRNKCENCQMLGQALIQHKGKPYDKLTLKNTSGQEVSYFFDISSFFGKW